jgi:hypothetical protein
MIKGKRKSIFKNFKRNFDKSCSLNDKSKFQEDKNEI